MRTFSAATSSRTLPSFGTTPFANSRPPAELRRSTESTAMAPWSRATPAGCASRHTSVSKRADNESRRTRWTPDTGRSQLPSAAYDTRASCRISALPASRRSCHFP